MEQFLDLLNYKPCIWRRETKAWQNSGLHGTCTHYDAWAVPSTAVHSASAIRVNLSNLTICRNRRIASLTDGFGLLLLHAFLAATGSALLHEACMVTAKAPWCLLLQHCYFLPHLIIVCSLAARDPESQNFHLAMAQDKFGDCLVPKRFWEDFELGDWTARIRVLLKDKQLPVRHFEILESMGFPWAVPEVSFLFTMTWICQLASRCIRVEQVLRPGCEVTNSPQ